jgi:SAM-dependent methyltransferase
MEFTGERVIPGQTDPDLLNEHIARYRFAEGLTGGRTVLDAGCGVGYGAAILAHKAARVYAVDLAAEAVAHGAREYSEVRFAQGSCTHLPFRDRSIDVVVAFEVIEHLEDWRGLLAESRRVLRPNGQLLVSTPNRLYYSETRTEPNPYHVHEFDYAEFRRELEAVFPHTTIFLENHTNAIAFTPERVQGLRTSVESGSPKPDEAHFFLAVCSALPQFGSPAFVFVPASGNVLREREKHIRLLESELAKKTDWLEETKLELARMAAINVQEQRKAQEALDRLEKEVEEKTAWARQLDVEHAELAAWSKRLEADYREALANYAKLEGVADERLGELKAAIAKIDELEARVVERSEWAMSLNRELETARARLAELYASPAYRIGRRLGLVRREITHEG